MHTYGYRLQMCIRCHEHKPIKGGKINLGPPRLFTCAECFALKLKKEPT